FHGTIGDAPWYPNISLPDHAPGRINHFTGCDLSDHERQCESTQVAHCCHSQEQSSHISSQNLAVFRPRLRLGSSLLNFFPKQASISAPGTLEEWLFYAGIGHCPILTQQKISLSHGRGSIRSALRPLRLERPIPDPAQRFCLMALTPQLPQRQPAGIP